MSQDEQQQEQTQDQKPVDQSLSDMVSKDVFERTKADMFKYKQIAEQNQKALEDAKIQRLKESQNWEAVAKAKEEEAESERKKREALQSGIMQHQKFMALKAEAVKHGIHPQSLDDLELLDLPDLQVETTSNGKILVTGAEKAILQAKVLRPHWFQQKAASVNPSSPETIPVQSAQVTLADLRKLEEAYKKDPSFQNKSAYYEAIKKFKTS